MFLDITHRLVFYVKCRPVYIAKHNVSETGFSTRSALDGVEIKKLQLHQV
jgi:hypothetical protein